MFRIGEFSKLTQVSVRMLRYYDEAGLLKPVEVDKWIGYRMYSVEQIPVLDIKPYTPSLDRVETPNVPEWCSEWPKSTEESGNFDWESVFNF